MRRLTRLPPLKPLRAISKPPVRRLTNYRAARAFNQFSKPPVRRLTVILLKKTPLNQDNMVKTGILTIV